MERVKVKRMRKVKQIEKIDPTKEFLGGLDAIVKEKGIDKGQVLEAMELALEGKFGVLTVIKDGKLADVPLECVVGENKEIGAVSGNTKESNIRKVTMDHDLVKTARNIGICLGD